MNNLPNEIVPIGGKTKERFRLNNLQLTSIIYLLKLFIYLLIKAIYLFKRENENAVFTKLKTRQMWTKAAQILFTHPMYFFHA